MIEFKCAGTGSSGNLYSLFSNKKYLLLDAGLSFSEIKKLIGFRIADVCGCVVSHSHKDHSRAVKDLQRICVPTWTPYAISDNVTSRRRFDVFTATCFPLPHDVTNYGYLIEVDGEKILYMTDFMYCPYNFKTLKINHMIIECNYSTNVVKDELPQFSHKVFGHCEQKTAEEFIRQNQTSELKTVIYIHMGEGLAPRNDIESSVRAILSENTAFYFASKGLCVNL